jgi:hypothetical protein
MGWLERERPRDHAFYAPSDAKRCKVTEEELKAAIQRFDFIVS